MGMNLLFAEVVPEDLANHFIFPGHKTSDSPFRRSPASPAPRTPRHRARSVGATGRPGRVEPVPARRVPHHPPRRGRDHLAARAYSDDRNVISCGLARPIELVGRSGRAPGIAGLLLGAGLTVHLFGQVVGGPGQVLDGLADTLDVVALHGLLGRLDLLADALGVVGRDLVGVLPEELLEGIDELASFLLYRFRE